MRRFKLTYLLACMAVISALVSGLVVGSAVQALTGTGGPPVSLVPNQASGTEKITLSCQYPSIGTYAGQSFAYSIEIQYTGGKEPRVFDLQAKVPDGFTYTIVPSYGSSSQINQMRLDPTKTFPDTLVLTITPSRQGVPPGDYQISMAASSGELKASIDLKATITAKYDLELNTSTGLLNTKATSGADNYLTLSVNNTGTADLEKIQFTTKTSAPSGWSITFEPSEIDLLPAGDSREVQVDIKPDKRSISGDYLVSITAEPQDKNAFGSFDLRVTVLTSPLWGWIGVAVVVLVVAGLGYLFVRLGRR